MKVLHVPYGIGMSSCAQALRKKGISATSWSLRTHHYDYLADRKVNFDQYSKEEEEKQREKFFQKALNKYDIFHFHFGETFFPDRRDLEILKKAGKKMVVHHRGSEVRMLSVARKFKNPYVKVKKSWPEKKIKANLKQLSKYIEHAIVNDYELYAYVEPYYKHVHVVPHTIDVDKITPAYPSAAAKPLIVHAPSRREIKGTKYVLNAIEKLEKSGLKFDFRLVEGLSHEEALSIYKKATVIIDQMQIGSYGHLAMEAMAMGKPVICYIRKDLVSKYPEGLPIINGDPVNLFKVLKQFISKPKEWERIGKQGRKYVESYHSYEVVADKLLHIYSQL